MHLTSIQAGYRERDRERETDRQTVKQTETDRQRQTESQTDRDRHTETDIQRQRCSDTVRRRGGAGKREETSLYVSPSRSETLEDEPGQVERNPHPLLDLDSLPCSSSSSPPSLATGVDPST